ncbi:MAG: glycosyltransferase family 4 protein [Dehalococcoidia bacterium]
MKIALVSPYDWLTPGGVNQHVDQLASELAQRGHDVRILAPATGAVDDPRVTVAGTPVPIPASGSRARITFDPRLGRFVRRFLEAEQFDVVHLHEPLMPTLPLQVLRHSRAANPNVVNVGTFHAHSAGGNRMYSYWRIVLKRWFRELDGKIAVSPPAAEYHHRYYPGYYNVIPNGIDVEHFARRDIEPLPDLEDGAINILYVGRAEKRKGLPFLIRAFGTVNARDPNTRLVVVSRDSRRLRRYRASVERQGRRGIVFADDVSNADLPRYHRSAQILCSPATGNESFGYVVVEGMAGGLPVVASNIAGYAYVMTHGVHGLLVPPRDTFALADALTSLVRDFEARRTMGAAGHERASEFSWPRVTQQVLSYYERLRYARGVSRPETDERVLWHA